MDKQIMKKWSVDKANQVYNIQHWGEGYFAINEAGCVEVKPNTIVGGKGVELKAIVEKVKQEGLHLPLLIRFPDILQDRVKRLYQAFAEVIKESGYQARYTPVYPIKVNQQRKVVTTIFNTPDVPVGLEAGSKPELMAILGLVQEKPAVIICNGYKDRSYIRAALIAQKIGHNAFIIIENLSEIDVVLREARELSVIPTIGVRVRLAYSSAGKWQNSNGEKAKFGLNASQALELINILKKAGLLASLQLMHCHLGSQIANIQDVQQSIREVARYYSEMRRLGAAIHTIDVGGGLGVDYEGTRSRSDCSINYSLKEYASNIVFALQAVCQETETPEPNIITESGRAMTAHHAVLITNVIDIEEVVGVGELSAPAPDEPHVMQLLREAYQAIESDSCTELYHDVAYALAEAHGLFNHGMLTLEDRAKAEQLYSATCLEVHKRLVRSSRGHRELSDELNERLAYKIFCNFSLFQSVPDVWAVNQIFPIMPITHLDEEPEIRGILQDLTCDSDGKVGDYVDSYGIETTLPLPKYNPQNPYDLAIFLVGAYQEILGDLHNLFGDTNSVHIRLTHEGHFTISEPFEGDTVADVLGYVNFDIEKIVLAYAEQIAAAPLPDDEKAALNYELQMMLNQSTYLAEHG